MLREFFHRASWLRPDSVLRSDPILSDVFKDDHTPEFQFTLRSGGPIRRNLVLVLTLNTAIYSTIDIRAFFTIKHPDGRAHDLTVTFAGDISRRSPTLVERTTITPTYLSRMRFISESHVELNFVFSSVSRIQQLPMVPSLNSILYRLLSPQKGEITASELVYLCEASSSIFRSQRDFLRLDVPLIIVGDIHGAFSDLVQIFHQFGWPSTANYLFLGDYVDIGDNSIATLELLLTFKIMFPENIFLLTGDHEAAPCREGGPSLLAECAANQLPVRPIEHMFETLPLAAVVCDRILCVHAGIPMTPLTRPMIDRSSPFFGLIDDLLTAELTAEVPNFSQANSEFALEVGANAIDEFLAKFDCSLIMRGHSHPQAGVDCSLANVITLMSAGVPEPRVLLLDAQRVEKDKEILEYTIVPITFSPGGGETDLFCEFTQTLGKERAASSSTESHLGD
jgi:serine/threonine-protein phosphatase PP1 catalytic subunit